MHTPHQWQHVMLAQTVKFNISHDNHLIVFDLKQGVVENRHRVHMVSRPQFGKHASNSFGVAL